MELGCRSQCTDDQMPNHKSDEFIQANQLELGEI